MNDILKCSGKNCSIRNNCKRFTALADKYSQAYNEWRESSGKCEGFYKNK